MIIILNLARIREKNAFDAELIVRNSITIIPMY